MQTHSLCIAVDGYLRTAIYDLQFENVYFISTHYWNDIVTQKADIKSKKLSFMSQVFMANPDKNISNMDNPEFDYPSPIANAIIEIDNTTEFDKLINHLEEVLCYNLQIIICDLTLTESYLEKIIHIISKSILKHCELIISYPNFLKTQELLTPVNFPEIFFLYVYNSPVNELKYASNEHPSTLFSTENFSYQSGSNVKSMNQFYINPVLYAESLHYNTYYNRKIFIDITGTIKNGPLSTKSIGNIYNNHSWKRLLNNSHFRKLWNIKKDDISICNVCEFRHMCTDARIPLPHANGTQWYHTSECNYNPFIAKWNYETDYLPLKDCGVSVSKKEVYVDEDTLSRILQTIYGQNEQHVKS